MAATQNAYRFVTPGKGLGFQLVVFALSERAAREYVKGQGISSLSHRALRFAGEGQPANPERWMAASVR